MNMTTLPKTTTFVVPGKDNPHGGIVATFTQWCDLWTWEVTYHLTSDPWWLQHNVTNSRFLPNLEDVVTDLRRSDSERSDNETTAPWVADYAKREADEAAAELQALREHRHQVARDVRHEY
jgi:hypothetical protein